MIIIQALSQLRAKYGPDVAEIIRRYSADEIDFSDLDFEYIPL